MVMTTRPVIENAPGLTWQWLARSGWEARWRAQAPAIAAGFSIKSQRIWCGFNPNEQERALIADRCNGLQNEMLVFLRGGVPMLGNARTLFGLIQSYKSDEFSSFHKVRYETQRTYEKHLRHIAEQFGETLLTDVTARSFMAWHRTWSDASGIATARMRIAIIRAMLTYGAQLLEDKQDAELCARLGFIVSKIKFERPAARVEHLTAEQANAIRGIALQGAYPSLALAQAIQFDCSFRQKDVVGEWVPISDKSISDVVDAAWGKKWGRGVRWEEVDAQFLLVHRTSKKGKVIAIPLLECPMVVEELARIAGVAPAELKRDLFPARGPIVVSEYRGLPWKAYEYRRLWRKAARTAGVPDHVLNMDSRAGAATEAQNAGVPLDERRAQLTHSSGNQTLTYSRGEQEKVVRSLKARAAYRKQESR
jgi:hypothetical protein